MKSSWTSVSAIVLVLAASLGFWLWQREDTTPETLEGELAPGETVTTGNAGEAPRFLSASFPNTDFTQSSVDLDQILSGGPGKDGIPALDAPSFIDLSDSDIRDEVQAIVYLEGETPRVYPYNILNWHEIVNDTVEDTPIAVTFCPLCGSAIVFNRTTSQGVSTFGVSGALLESNMIMYDRASETLWQQSTGQAIAGQLNDEQLELEPFQLLTMAEIREKYPDAIVLSENTGFSRDYDRNPYSGYEEDEGFFFSPSVNDTTYPAKDIFVIYNYDGMSYATPWLALEDSREYNNSELGANLRLVKTDGELTITDSSGSNVPFYFEMWFSWAVQHQERGETAAVYDPEA